MLVVHVITCLDDGGAEAVLYRLCLAEKANAHVVISLQDEGKYGSLLEKAGIAVRCLDMPRGLVTPRGIWKLVHHLRELRPEVIQTWMYHADLVGGIVARLLGIRRIYWGFHNTAIDNATLGRTTMLLARLNSYLSRWVPRRIVSCSQAGITQHCAIGYAKGQFIVVPNGYDLGHFTPDLKRGRALRSTLPVPDDVPLLGMVARFHPQKDHLNLIKALGLLAKDGQDFRCLLIGTGISEKNGELVRWLNAYNMRDRVFLLGQRNDIEVVMNALDIHILSSSNEAFPNVLCEAMACTTPCVTTDVGDAALIVRNTGWVVPPKSPTELANALLNAIQLRLADPEAWKRRRLQCRQHIADNFTIDKMVANYQRIWAT